MSDKTGKTAYNPRETTDHHGKVYVTKEEIIWFDSNGRYNRKKYLEGDSALGAVPEMIAGIDPKHKENIQLMFAGHQRAGLIQLIEQEGEEVTPGKLLVGVLNANDTEKRDRIGFYSTLPVEAKN